MKCPKCNEEIDSVWVESRCLQKAELDGTKVINYGAVDDVGETIAIFCPECDADIRSEVQE